jgi:hypothetical protein
MPRDFKLNATKSGIVANVDIGEKQIVAVFTRDGHKFEASTAGVGKGGRDLAIAEVRRRIGAAPEEFNALLRRLRPFDGGLEGALLDEDLRKLLEQAQVSQDDPE